MGAKDSAGTTRVIEAFSQLGVTVTWIFSFARDRPQSPTPAIDTREGEGERG